MFERRFKTSAERIAEETREEMGLLPVKRLDPLDLAEFLGIPVVKLSELRGIAGAEEAVGLLMGSASDELSAFTIFEGTRRIIFHNDSHHPHRIASNLAHELGHCLLEHEPAPALVNGHCRHWDPRIEEEASWLGAALLIPRTGALTLAKRGMKAPQIAERYGTSVQLCEWRLRATGVLIQAERAFRYFAGN